MSLSKAVFARMGTFMIIVPKPLIQIDLQFLNRWVDYFTKGDIEKFIEDSTMKPLADTVGLWSESFCFGVVNILDCQI